MNPLYRLINFIAPDSCIVCATEGAMLCESCREAELLPMASSCFRCGKVTRAFSTCTPCKKVCRLESLYVASRYEGISKELVQQTKFSHYRGGIDVMACLMNNTLPETGFDVVTHSPTTSSRVRERGFDQAKAIAKQVARSKRLPYVDCIIRTDNTHQVGKSRTERFRHAEGAYRINSPTLIIGKNILIVDDVCTTGATLTALAKLLNQSGANYVAGCVFAR